MNLTLAPSEKLDIIVGEKVVATLRKTSQEGPILHLADDDGNTMVVNITSESKQCGRCDAKLVQASPDLLLAVGENEPSPPPSPPAITPDKDQDTPKEEDCPESLTEEEKEKQAAKKPAKTKKEKGLL